ncbi:MAG: HAD family hydrolase [Fimbriiglobus sp.]
MQAILFDFDGTLADSFGAITASVNHVRGLHGLGTMTEKEVQEYVGLGLRQLMRDLLPGVTLQDALAEYEAHHPSVMFTGTKLFEGVNETLLTLKTQGFRLGVCSNKKVEFTRELVSRLCPPGIFEVVLGPEDVGVPKPDPAMLFEAARRLGVPIADCLYIGDMTIDVRTARAAGMPVWLMPGGARGPDHEQLPPDHWLRDFPEIAERLA